MVTPGGSLPGGGGTALSPIGVLTVTTVVSFNLTYLFEVLVNCISVIMWSYMF